MAALQLEPEQMGHSQPVARRELARAPLEALQQAQLVVASSLREPARMDRWPQALELLPALSRPEESQLARAGGPPAAPRVEESPALRPRLER